MGRMEPKEPFLTIRKSAVRYWYKIRRISFSVHAQAERKEEAKASTLSSVEIYSRMCSAAFSQVHHSPTCVYTDKKEIQIFHIYKKIQNGAVANSYMANGRLIYG
jgi:hypothetical protein